jgi:hypothetical protein
MYSPSPGIRDSWHKSASHPCAEQRAQRRHARGGPASHAWLSFALLWSAACASDLRERGADEHQEVSPKLPVTNSQEAAGVTRTVIDATADEVWLYFDLESAARVEPEQPDDSPLWDLAFERFKIKLNGGVSGSGDVSAAHLDAVAFSGLATAPDAEYVTDQADGDDENEEPDLIVSSGDAWFAYDPSNHTLMARDRTYVLRSVEKNYYKLQMLEYYDAAGTAGYPAFHWARVDPPEVAHSAP